MAHLNCQSTKARASKVSAGLSSDGSNREASRVGGPFKDLKSSAYACAFRARVNLCAKPSKSGRTGGSRVACLTDRLPGLESDGPLLAFGGCLYAFSDGSAPSHRLGFRQRQGGAVSCPLGSYTFTVVRPLETD
jgi:hypothetical protein